jgi:hypothetical protein
MTLLLALVACSAPSVPSEHTGTAPDPEETSDTGDTADSDAPWFSDSLPYAPFGGPSGSSLTCEQTDRDPEAGCPGCGLDLDATLRCDTTSLWEPNVGPTADGAWFANCKPAFYYTLKAGEALVSSGRYIQWKGAECDVLVHPDGTTDLLVNETVTDAEWEGGLAYDGGSGREPIIERGTCFVEPLGIALVVGVPTVWYERDGSPAAAARGADGSWASIATDLPGDIDWRRVTVGPDGAPVGFGDRDGELVAFIQGAEHAIGEGRYPYEWDVARPPPEGLPAGAADAVLVRLADAGLGVGFVRPEAVVEHTLADTARAVSNCDTDTCSGSCHEVYEGLEGEGTFATARATDGGAWVAWLSTSFDRMVAYEREYIEYVGHECVATVSDDVSVATLHLVHVAENGAVTERFVMEVPRPAPAGMAFDYMHVAAGFGRVAIGFLEFAGQVRVIALPE